MLDELLAQTKQLSDPAKAKFLAGFFKTGVGQYGEGDVFYGLTVPVSRKIAKKYTALPFEDVALLLQSKVHEQRLIALLILVEKYRTAESIEKKEIFNFYLAHTNHINNWDLVDLSAPKIVGEYLFGCQTQKQAEILLSKLAHSKNLWEKRIAMLATFAYILHGEAALSLKIADILLLDNYDLIQKAVGWMLREVGKRISSDIEEDFLKSRYKTMPRTALRYAIERFPEAKRKQYLLGLA